MSLLVLSSIYGHRYSLLPTKDIRINGIFVPTTQQTHYSTEDVIWQCFLIALTVRGIFSKVQYTWHENAHTPSHNTRFRNLIEAD